MARYIDEELLMQKLSRMIDYVEKNKDKKFNALNVLFQVGDAIMDCPTADVAPKSEVAREIFEEIDDVMIDHARGDIDDHWLYVRVSELKKKYTEEKL